MAAAVSVVEEAEDYSFLPIIHDIIKWWDLNLIVFYVLIAGMGMSSQPFCVQIDVFVCTEIIHTRYSRASEQYTVLI